MGEDPDLQETLAINQRKEVHNSYNLLIIK